MKKKKIPAEPEFEPEIIDDQKDIELTQDIIELEQWKNIDCDITKKIINIRKKVGRND